MFFIVDVLSADIRETTDSPFHSLRGPVSDAGAVPSIAIDVQGQTDHVAPSNSVDSFYTANSNADATVVVSEGRDRMAGGPSINCRNEEVERWLRGSEARAVAWSCTRFQVVCAAYTFAFLALIYIQIFKHS